MPDILPILISDAEIRAMLKPRSIFERYKDAVTVLALLCKYGELPSCVLRKAVGKRYALELGHRPMQQLVDEKYVTARKGKHRGTHCNFFKVTPKGRRALAEYTPLNMKARST